jgi:UDP-glucose 4-epimerase
VKGLITGGAGFIGSTLADRLLAEGWSVDVADDLSSGNLANLAEARRVGDRRFSFHRIDIRNAAISDLIESRRPDVVFHLAAQADVRVSVARPQFDAEVNVIGTLNVCQGALAAGAAKVVFASSGGTIYGTPEEIPTPETHPQRPESPYGVAKKVGGDYLHYYRAIHGLESVATAFSNVYGPRQDPHGEAGVVAIFAGLFLERRRPTIFGDGNQTRDFVYVDDAPDALVRAAGQGQGIVNIGTGVETSVNDLYGAMSRSTGFNDPPSYAPARAGELARSALDVRRAASELGWRPFTSLDEGVGRTLEWFRHRRA